MRKKICFVTSTWGQEEETANETFAGSSAALYYPLLDRMGISLSDCHFTSVFKFRPYGGKLEGLACRDKRDAMKDWPQLLTKLSVDRKFEHHLFALFDEINDLDPNIIVPMGLVPLWALAKEKGIKKHRGTPMSSGSHTQFRKMIPTHEPKELRASWKLRPIIQSDLRKIKDESEFPELRRPSRKIWIKPQLEDLETFYEKHIIPAPYLSVDIETKAGTITEVGIATDEVTSLVIPFYQRRGGGGSYWPTLDEEICAWRFIRRVLSEKPCLGQNFNYDLQYLWQKMAIPIRSVYGDTMILHHALYPEMEKSLGFMGSLYTKEPSWKFMRSDAENFRSGDE